MSGSKTYLDKVKCTHCGYRFTCQRRKSSAGRVVATYCTGCFRTFNAFAKQQLGEPKRARRNAKRAGRKV